MSALTDPILPRLGNRAQPGARDGTWNGAPGAGPDGAFGAGDDPATNSATGRRVTIRCLSRGDIGWGPIDHLLTLMQRLLGAEVQESGTVPLAKLRRLRRSLWRPPRSSGDVVIYLVHYPHQITNVVANPAFDTPAAYRVIWIVDSFLSEQMPRGLLSNFDLVVYMQGYEADFYERASRGRALLLPWGTDALDMGSGAGDRDIDVLRVGRQPRDWDDDNRSAAACARHGLSFHGRPALDISYPDLMRHYARARFMVAFSNLLAPSHYTHTGKAYFTGRWTDAIAAGAVVAGISPREDTAAGSLLGETALLEFRSLDLEENLGILRQAVDRWTPQIAQRNHLNALRMLDWRWRLRRLADRLDLSCPELDRDLERLQNRILDIDGPA